MALPGDTTPAGHGQRSARFVARESELARVHRRLKALSAGRGGLLLVEGHSGDGASTLVRQAAGRALQMGIDVLWGEGGEGALDRPYGGLAEALELHGLALDPKVLQADLGADAGPLARICPALAERLPSLTPAVPLDAGGAQLRLREAVVGWLRRTSARAPLLVVVDGLDGADTDVAGLLEHLARRLRGDAVLIIVVRELAADSTPPGRLRGTLETITVGGLDIGAVAMLLAEWSDRPVMPATVALVNQVSDGRPLLSRLLQRHLVEERLLPGPGSTHMPTPDELPHSIGDLVAWAVARLSHDAGAALNVLACFPQGTQAHVVASVAGLAKARALEALEEVTKAGLATTDRGGTGHVVVHPAIRRSLLGALSSITRAHLHRRVAQTIEADVGEARRGLARVLAHHWSESAALPGREPGIEFCLLATEQALAAYAPGRAAQLLARAMVLAPARGDSSARVGSSALTDVRRDIHVRTAHALAESGAASESLSEARNLLSADGLTALVEVLRTLRGSGVDAKEWPRIDELRIAALDLARDDRSLRADRLLLARLELLAENWQALDMGGVRVLAWTDPQDAAAATLLRDGSETDGAETMLVQRPRDHAQTAAAAAAARAWRRPPAVLRALACTVADLVTRQGLFSEGGGWATQYLATAQRYGARRDETAATLALARCQTALGEFAAADDLIAAATQQLAAIGDKGALADELLLARLALNFYRDEDWEPYLRQLTPSSARQAGLALAAQRTVAHVRLGNEAEAHQHITTVLEATAQLPPLTYWRDAALFGCLAAVWELGSAEHAALGSSLVELAAAGGAGGQIEGTLGLARARLHALSGTVEAARALFATERDGLATAGLRPLRALCDHDEAIAIAAASPAAYGEAAHLLEATATQFDTLGMTGWSHRTRALLDGGLEAAAAPGGRLAFTYPRGLSRREADVVRLIAGGATPDEAATALVLERAAVERLLLSAIDKLGGQQRDELPALARRYGLGGA